MQLNRQVLDTPNALSAHALQHLNRALQLMNQNKKTKKSFGNDDLAPHAQGQQGAYEEEKKRRVLNIINEDTDDEGDDEDKRGSKRRRTRDDEDTKMCKICFEEITDEHGFEIDGYLCDCRDPLHVLCLKCMQKLKHQFAMRDDLQCPTCRSTCKRMSMTGYPGKGQINKINVIFSTHEQCKLEIRQDIPDAKLMQEGDDGRWIPRPSVQFDQFNFIKTITQNLLTRGIITKESKISWENEVFTGGKKSLPKKVHNRVHKYLTKKHTLNFKHQNCVIVQVFVPKLPQDHGHLQAEIILDAILNDDHKVFAIADSLVWTWPEDWGWNFFVVFVDQFEENKLQVVHTVF